MGALTTEEREELGRLRREVHTVWVWSFPKESGGEWKMMRNGGRAELPA